MNNLHLAVQFFLQLSVILLFCRVVGASAARDTQSYLFPASQLGLALYLFVVGMEFRVDLIRGAGLAWILFFHTEFFPKQTSLVEAMLFLGASMRITAFPMVARIIHFKKLNGTTMGAVAIGAGAIDDATAWCLLAVVLASFNNNFSHAALNIGLQRGVISEGLFASLVIMAVVTSLMASPIFERLFGTGTYRPEDEKPAPAPRQRRSSPRALPGLRALRGAELT